MNMNLNQNLNGDKHCFVIRRKFSTCLYKVTSSKTLKPSLLAFSEKSNAEYLKAVINDMETFTKCKSPKLKCPVHPLTVEEVCLDSLISTCNKCWIDVILYSNERSVYFDSEHYQQKSCFNDLYSKFDIDEPVF